MKLSKELLEIIENENNELGDTLLAMIDEPDNTRDDIVAAATAFMMNSPEYDGNILALNRFVAINIIGDDEEEDEEEDEFDEDIEDEDDEDELTAFDIADSACDDD